MLYGIYKLEDYLYLELYGNYMDPEHTNYTPYKISSGLKISLLAIYILTINIANSAYAVNKQTDLANDKSSYKNLNDPTRPKITISTEESADLKDPNTTVTTKSSVTNSEKLKLSMIIIKKNDRSAVINDTIVREKDQISGYEITKIESNKVILKNPKNKAANQKTPQEPKLPGTDSFTELKLPAVIIKSFFTTTKHATEKENYAGVTK